MSLYRPELLAARQYASGSAPEMLDPLRTLFRLHPDLDLAYLDRHTRRKRQAIMVSKTSAFDRIAGWPGKVIRHDEFAAALADRRAAAGNPAMPRNEGTRRTPSKRALLKAIEEAGGKW